MPDSLERLFRAEYRRLVQALAVYAGSQAAAEDAVQDAYVQASRHWSRIGRYEDPARWVRRVAINRLANRGRGMRRAAAALPKLVEPSSNSVDVDTPLDVRAAVAALAPQQRLAVTLYYLADLPLIEVAAAMQVTEGTVKSHLYDARRALSVVLEDCSDH